MKNELKNCLSCGRDIRAVSGYCFRCIGHSTMSCHGDSQIDDRRDRPQLQVGEELPFKYTNLDIEDDYGEDSDPDSICA